MFKSCSVASVCAGYQTLAHTMIFAHVMTTCLKNNVHVYYGLMCDVARRLHTLRAQSCDQWADFPRFESYSREKFPAKYHSPFEYRKEWIGSYVFSSSAAKVFQHFCLTCGISRTSTHQSLILSQKSLNLFHLFQCLLVRKLQFQDV